MHVEARTKDKGRDSEILWKKDIATITNTKRIKEATRKKYNDSETLT